MLPAPCLPGETPERIFVSRSDAAQRLLLDEELITDYLTKNHDFKVVIPGQMSIAPPQLLVELFQPDWVREAYCRQAQIKGAAYAAYIGKTEGRNLSVNKTKFFELFEKCLAEIDVSR